MTDKAKDPEELPDDVEELVAALQGSATRVQVWRRGGTDARMGPYEYSTSVPLDGFTLEEIREQFGGGDYSARFCDAKGRVIRTALFRVSGKPKRMKDDDAGGGDDGPPGWARQLLERVERMESSRGGGGDRGSIELATALMAAQSQMFVPVLELLGKREAAPAPAGMSPLEMFELIERGMELAREQGGGDGGLFASLGAPLLATLQQLSAAEGIPVTLPGGPTPPKLANPNAPEGTPMQQPNAGPPPPAWVRMLAEHVQRLCQLAQLAARTDVWAARIVDTVSDAQLLTLEEELARPEFMREFLAYFPQATEHRKWFADLWSDLQLEISQLERDDDDDDDDDGREAGQGGDRAP